VGSQSMIATSEASFVLGLPTPVRTCSAVSVIYRCSLGVGVPLVVFGAPLSVARCAGGYAAGRSSWYGCCRVQTAQTIRASLLPTATAALLWT
jgi:hypothetical protein